MEWASSEQFHHSNSIFFHPLLIQSTLGFYPSIVLMPYNKQIYILLWNVMKQDVHLIRDFGICSLLLSNAYFHYQSKIMRLLTCITLALRAAAGAGHEPHERRACRGDRGPGAARQPGSVLAPHVPTHCSYAHGVDFR